MVRDGSGGDGLDDTERPEARALVVDDDALLRRVVADALGRQGDLRVTTCESGEEALRAISATAFDVVVSGLVMPGVDGFAILDHLMTLGDDRPAFVVVSAAGDAVRFSEALERGAADFLRKPFDPDELRARVTAALTHRAEHLRVRRAEALLIVERDRLAASEEEHRSIVETAVDAIITMGADGRIRSFNPAAERIFGWAADEVVGREVSLLMPEPDRSGHDGYVRRHRDTGQRRVIGIGREVTGLRRDGTPFPMHLSVGEMEIRGERLYTGIVRDISAAKSVEQSLRDSEARHRTIVETARSGIVTIDERGCMEDVNGALTEMFGYDREELIGRNVAMLMHGHDAASHDGHLSRYLSGGDPRIIGVGREVVGRRKDGSRIHVHLSVGRMDIAGRTMFTGLLRDVTDRVVAEEELRRQHDYVRTLVDSIQDGLLVVSGDDRVVDVNGRFCDMTGFSREEVLRSGMPRPWWPPDLSEEVLGRWREVTARGGGEYDAVYQSADGAPLPVIVGVSVLPGSDGERAYIAIVKDATERRRQAQHLEAMATTDHLTGLLNHRAFHERLHAEWGRIEAEGSGATLILLDLDHFKRVNDTYGHPAGDAVLAELARRLRSHARATDVLARVGGEEFAWLLPNTGPDEALAAAGRVRAAIADRPFPGVGLLTGSLGLCSSGHAMGASELYQMADEALYAAKARGRDNVTAYSPDLRAELDAAGEVRPLRPGHQHTISGVLALARAVDAKDPATRRHSGRVADLAVRLATAAGWSLPRCILLRDAGLMHDVGKIAIPDAILLKPGRLTPEEYDVVKTHSAIGAEIAAEVLSDEQARWVRHHHERYDGSGYPDGLAGEAIPPGARILAVADAFDVMVTPRAYAAGRGLQDALDECRRHSGTQFDPAVVAQLERLVEAGAMAAAGAV